MKNFRELVSFMATFGVLGRMFLAHRPLKNYALAGLSALLGLLYPIPLLVLLLVALAVATGQAEVSRDIMGTTFSLPIVPALIASAIMLGVVYTVRVFAGSALFGQARIWQKDLFTSLVRAHMSVGDLRRTYPEVTVEGRAVTGWASRIGQAGTQVAMLFVYGLNSLSIMAVLSVILLVISWKIALGLVASFVIMLPFYGIAMRGIRDTRRELSGKIKGANAQLAEYTLALQAASGGTDVEPPHEDAFAQMHFVGFQHHFLLILQLVAGLHVGGVLMLMVLFGDGLGIGLEDGVIAIVAGYFLLRTTVGFVQFLGQLVRNYENLSFLRQWLRPVDRPLSDVMTLRSHGRDVLLQRSHPHLLDTALPAGQAEIQALKRRIVPAHTGPKSLHLATDGRPVVTGEAAADVVQLLSVDMWRTLDDDTRAAGYWIVYGQNSVETSTVLIVDEDPRLQAGPDVRLEERLGGASAELLVEQVDAVVPANPGPARSVARAPVRIGAVKTSVLKALGIPQSLQFEIMLTKDGPPVGMTLLCICQEHPNVHLPKAAYFQHTFSVGPEPVTISIPVALHKEGECSVTSLYLLQEEGAEETATWSVGNLRVVAPEHIVVFDRYDDGFFHHRNLPHR